MLVVLLSPVAPGAGAPRRAAGPAHGVLRDPGVRWTPYEAVVVRARWRPPVVALADGRHVLTLGLLGRRVLPPCAPGSSERVVVRLAGDLAAGGILWAPRAGALGYARPRTGPGRRARLPGTAHQRAQEQVPRYKAL